MNLNVLISTPALVSIIVVAAVLFIAGVIVLYLLVIRNKRLNHSIVELNRRYEYIHVLLTEQDASHIKRLENISQLNLLYNDIYQEYLTRFTPLKNEADGHVKELISDLRVSYNTGKFALARKNYSEAKNALMHFENQVNILDEDLTKISQTETELRRKVVEAKDRVSAIKDKQEAYQNELAFMKNTYDAIYAHIDSLFEKFDSYIEVANYDEAAVTLNEINKVIAEFSKGNEVIPNLCVRATKLIPQKISDLKYDLKRMQAEGCPTQSVVNDKIIKEIEVSLEKVSKDLKRFVYKNVDKNLDIIDKNLDSILAGFENERKDKKEFESISDSVDISARKYQNEFVKLCNTVHNIKKYYVISEEKEKQLEKINNKVDHLAFNKRSFDDLSHGQVKQPYSRLLSSANMLKEKNADIKEELANFRQYLSSLKVDVEAAHKLLSTTYYRIKKVEKILRDASIDSLTNKYADKLNAIYDELDKISIMSNTLPINVEKINASVNFIKLDGESCFNQIEQDVNMMHMAESTIVFANRGRNNSNEINAAVVKSEKYFNDGEYERAHDEVSECIKKYNEEEPLKKKY